MAPCTTLSSLLPRQTWTPLLPWRLITGQPVLFADLRSYCPDKNVWDLCNLGSHSTFFAGKSKDPSVNLANTEFRLEGFYYPGGGPSRHHIARPGEATLARFTRSGGTRNYKMVAVHMEFVSFGAAAEGKLGASEPDNWPHARRLRRRLHARDVPFARTSF